MDISTLRNQSSLDKLLKQVEKEESPQSAKKSYQDDRLWKPNVDKSGNGYAVLRFLPQKEGEDLPWVRVYNHAFQGPTGQWFIENCLTSKAGGKFPCCEHNSTLWNSGIEADKEVARKQKRKLSYYANVYVVSDPANPENEGKVMLYKFGKKIYDKLMEAMSPEFQDEEAINPFDVIGGANFKLKIRRVDGYWNYDKSEFDRTGQLFDDEQKILDVCNKVHSLDDFLADSNFKSYDELKKRLDIVLSGTVATSTAAALAEEEEEFTPQFKEEPAPQPVSQSSSYEEDEDDDTMSYFEKLANE